MLRITRHVSIVRRVFVPAPAPPLSLWERTPKLVHAFLSVLLAFTGKIVGEALQGGQVVQFILAAVGGIAGFYLLRMTLLLKAVLVIAALIGLTAFAVWLERLLVHR